MKTKSIGAAHVRTKRRAGAAQQELEAARAEVVRLTQQLDEQARMLDALRRGRAEDAETVRKAIEDRERVEQERDEARRLHGKAILDGSAAVSRAERAEADNAEMLDFVRQADSLHIGGAIKHRAFAILSADHPGTALLEYVKVLESEHEAVKDAVEAMEGAWPARPVTLLLRRMFNTVVALKERKP